MFTKISLVSPFVILHLREKDSREFLWIAIPCALKNCSKKGASLTPFSAMSVWGSLLCCCHVKAQLSCCGQLGDVAVLSCPLHCTPELQGIRRTHPCALWMCFRICRSKTWIWFHRIRQIPHLSSHLVLQRLIELFMWDPFGDACASHVPGCVTRRTISYLTFPVLCCGPDLHRDP